MTYLIWFLVSLPISLLVSALIIVVYADIKGGRRDKQLIHVKELEAWHQKYPTGEELVKEMEEATTPGGIRQPPASGPYMEREWRVSEEHIFWVELVNWNYSGYLYFRDRYGPSWKREGKGYVVEKPVV